MVIGIHKTTEPFEFDESGWFEHEKPAVLEAFRVLAKEGYYISISGHDYNEREKRLKKEYEENTKSPGPGEEQPEEKKGIIYPTTFPKADFYYKHVLNEGNPALKEAASQFNEALLDEQAKEIESLRDKCKKYADILDSVRDKLRELKAENRRIKNSDLNLEGLIYATRELKEKDKKIEKLAKENERLKDQIAVLDACKKHNDKIDRLQIKRLGKEIARLNGIIHDKNEEIKRKTKGCCELVTENVDLKKKLSDKDAVLSDVAEELRLSKIREKNLTEVCQKYMKENKELWATLADNVVDKIDAQALKSAESALAYKEKEIEKLQKQLKYKSPLPFGSVEAINIYVENISRARRGGFNKSVASTMGETELSETYEYGDKKLKYALHFNEDGSITYECSDPDKKSRIPTPEESKYDSLIERCKRLGIELHYHDGEVPTYTNVFGDEVPVYGLRGIFATCTDEEYKSLFKK